MKSLITITKGTLSLSRRYRSPLSGVLFILIVSIILFAQAYQDKAERQFLTVAFLDVGQGDAIFIEAPNGYQMLIDAGGGIEVIYKLQEFMPFYDKTIDTIMISNPDKDHIGGFIHILNRYEVTRAIEPGTFNESQTYETIRELIGEEKAEDILAKDIKRVDIDPKKGIYFDVFFPDKDVSDLTTNDGSIVGMLRYASTSILFTGDTTKSTESYLLKVASTSLDADILKVAHHGSRTSSSDDFIKMVSPEVAVISMGKDNSYNHPHRETIQTLQNNNISVLRTDEEGTIVLQTDGEKYWFR